MVSPASSDDGASAAAAVCCMCGDRGLPGELIQCALCLQRLQHRYCSDQYPSMAAYSICNWCLRDKEVGGGSPSPPAAKALTARAKQRASSRLNGSRGHHDDKDQPCVGGSGGGCSRSAFPAEPQKPVKKPKKSHETAARRPAAAKGTEVQTGGARTKPLFRAKARVPRFKLLTELSWSERPIPVPTSPLRPSLSLSVVSPSSPPWQRPPRSPPHSRTSYPAAPPLPPPPSPSPSPPAPSGCGNPASRPRHPRPPESSSPPTAPSPSRPRAVRGAGTGGSTSPWLLSSGRGATSVKERLTAATGAEVPFHHVVVQEGRVSILVLGYAHCGMVVAARWIAKQAILCLSKAMEQFLEYEVKVVFNNPSNFVHMSGGVVSESEPHRRDFHSISVGERSSGVAGPSMDKIGKTPAY